MDQGQITRLENEVLILTDRVSREETRAIAAERIRDEMVGEVTRLNRVVELLEGVLKKQRAAIDESLVHALTLRADHDPTDADYFADPNAVPESVRDRAAYE